MRTLISWLLPLALPGALVAGEARLARHPSPSPDGATVLFSYQGDLWSVDAGGGSARRLTIHPGIDRFPIWSRDGKQIAFASDRHGSFDVFVVPSDWSAVPRRLTFADVSDYPVDFTPDGTAVLFVSRRLESTRRQEGLFRVPVSGGTPALEQPSLARNARYSPDGKTLALVRGSTSWLRRGYNGSGSRDLWLRIGDAAPTRLTTFDGDDDAPSWVDDHNIVFLSSRTERKNLHLVATATGMVRALTSHSDHDVRFPRASADGRIVAYELDDAIWTVATDSGTPKRLSIDVPTDIAENPVERHKESSDASELAVSPDGKRVAIVVHGDVFVVATRSKDDQEIALPPSHQVTATPGREQDVAWSSDGTSLLFSSDRHGSLDLYTATHEKADGWDASVPKLVRITSSDREEYSGRFSPDGKSVAFVRGNGDLIVRALEAGVETTLLTHWSQPEFVWSPDGRWIAYATVDLEFNSEIWIIATDGNGEPYNVSRHPDHDSEPSWSPDGRRLVWISHRHGDTGDVWSVWLQKLDHERTPEGWLAHFKSLDKKKSKKGDGKQDDADKTGKRSVERTLPDDELGSSSPDDEDGKEEPKKKELPEVIIDFDDLWRRTASLTSLERDESSPRVSSDGKTVFFVASPDDESDLYSVRWDGKERKRLTEGNSRPRALQLDDEDTLYHLTPKGTIKRLDAKGKAGDPLPFEARFTVDLAAERAAVFDEAWRTIGANFYDPAMHGVDWDAARDRFRPLALAAAHDFDFSDVINLMLGELDASHLGYRSLRERDGDETTGWLGALFDPDAGGRGLLVREVLPGSPAARVDVGLTAGDRLLTIDGYELGPSSNAYEPLIDTAGHSVRLGILAADGRERSAELVPIGFSVASQLRYAEWVRQRQAIVERTSGGRLGYLHIQGMSIPSFETFERDLYAAGHGKEGLIIDVRSNGGGWTTDYLMAALTVRRHARTVPRDADASIAAYPQSRLPLAAWTRPALTLCDEDSYSNAEIFSHAFRTLGRGMTVGVPTFGAVISTGATKLVNGATLRLPFRGWYVAGSDLNMENNGFVPDVIVERPPNDDTASDQDAQLERAVELFLAGLESDPRRNEW